MRDTHTLPTHPAIATSQRPTHTHTSCDTTHAVSPTATSLEVGLPVSAAGKRRNGRIRAGSRIRRTLVRNWYCDETGCRRTRLHIQVLMGGRRYQYCVHCGRRKEFAPRPLVTEVDPIHARRVLGRF